MADSAAFALPPTFPPALPNEFGFFRAKAMLSHGFPYAAVAHLTINN